MIEGGIPLPPSEVSTAEWRIRRGGGQKNAAFLFPSFCRPQQEEGIAKNVILLSCAKQQICFPLVKIRMSLFVASTSHLSPPPLKATAKVCTYVWPSLLFLCPGASLCPAHTNTHILSYASDTFPNGKEIDSCFFKCRERVLELFFLTTSFFFFGHSLFHFLHYTSLLPICYTTLLVSSVCKRKVVVTLNVFCLQLKKNLLKLSSCGLC